MLLLDVTAVETTADFALLLTFENGERRRFNMRPLLGRKPFEGLQAPQRFAEARVAYGTVVWPGEIDVAPETLYADSVAV
jgi:hypothetical protein